MATHSSVLPWEIPWAEEPGGLQAMGVAKSQTLLSDLTKHAHCFWFFSSSNLFIFQGFKNILKYFWLNRRI